MKFLGLFLVVAAVSFGQEVKDISEIAKSTVLISVRLSGDVELRATGIRIGPGVVVIPAKLIMLKSTGGGAIFVNEKQVKTVKNIGNDMLLLSLELSEGDARMDFLQPTELRAGEQPVWCVGYRHGQLAIQIGNIMISPGRTLSLDPASTNVGIGWGIFSVDGRFLAMVQDHTMIFDPGSGLERSRTTITLRSGQSILADAGKFLAIPSKF